MIGIGVALLIAALAPSASAKVSAAEVREHQREKSELVSSAFTQIAAIGADEEGCVAAKNSGDQRIISAWKRTIRGTADDARQDAKDWNDLEKWGDSLRPEASTYEDRDDRDRVRSASGQIVRGAAHGHSSLEQAAQAFDEFAALKCNDPGEHGKKASNFLDQASKLLGDGFQDLNRVVKG